jgi:disulfide bond formation protein DsbB
VNDAVILFLCMLAVLCQIFVVVMLVLWIAARWSTGAKNALTSVTDSLGSFALPFAFAVALVTMLGSLYLSEVKHYTPCNLCWYQRICLYPLTPILGVALFRRDKRVWPYAVALGVVDVPISIYHYLLEWYPNLETSVCTSTTPCTLVYVRKFHYVSVPLMALTCAATVITLMLMARRAHAIESAR